MDYCSIYCYMHIFRCTICVLLCFGYIFYFCWVFLDSVNKNLLRTKHACARENHLNMAWAIKGSKLDSELTVLVLALLAVSSCIIIRQNTIRFGKFRAAELNADHQASKISAPFIRKTHSASRFKFGTE